LQKFSILTFGKHTGAFFHFQASKAIWFLSFNDPSFFKTQRLAIDVIFYENYSVQ
jgi:hypothetical protein